MGNWEELLQNYPKKPTPAKLVEAVKTSPTGIWFSYGYPVEYSSKTDGNVIVVDTEIHTPSKSAAGGHYILNAKNLTECVEDF